MSKSGTWPSGVALESSSNMDSAESCDSVISMTSACSEDSMEHLSAEERACLMYLEEMIESLEVQEDSGLSNDEPDSGRVAKTFGHLTANDIFRLKSEPKRNHSSSAPLADGTGSFPPRVPEVPVEPGTGSLDIQHKPEHYAVNHTPEPQSPDSAQPSDTTDLKESVTQPEASLTGADSSPPDTRLYPGQPTRASGGEFGLIPPPSDFRDESDQQPRKVRDIYQLAGAAAARRSVKPVDLEQLLQKVSTKGASSSPSPTPQEPSLMHLGDTSSPPYTSGFQSNSFTPAEPRSPPAVAPKPKKLPSNITVKPHKTTAAASDGSLGQPVFTPSDHLLMDHDQVHLEALRKLGLLKNDDTDSSPTQSPKHSPKSRSSWAAPASPRRPATPQNSTPPATPLHGRAKSYTSPSVPLASTSPAAVSRPDTVQPAEVLPAPPAFSDPVGSLWSDTEPTGDFKTQGNASPIISPPTGGIKSATLDHSDPDLSNYTMSQDFSESSRGVSGDPTVGHLRNARLRPASLGSGREFSDLQGAGLQVGQAASKDQNSRRTTLPAAGYHRSTDSQKLPGSHGISVLISPRGQSEEDRREALKKLGLLRD